MLLIIIRKTLSNENICTNAFEGVEISYNICKKLESAKCII
jgi:hypothetical protein